MGLSMATKIEAIQGLILIILFYLVGFVVFWIVERPRKKKRIEVIDIEGVTDDNSLSKEGLLDVE